MADRKVAEERLLQEQIGVLQARMAVLELRQKTTDEELAELKRELNALTETIGGFIE